MTESSLTTLIGNEIQGGDGFFYGIPCDARRVVKYNPLDKSLTEIGPDLGGGIMKWLLKINTMQGTVDTLDDVELPETSDLLPL
jgi:hypothetical protein